MRDLTLEIADGEFFILLGPSGCGKTTALRIAAGLEEPTGGAIYIGDRQVTEVPAKDRDLAMVFQNYALYPHMTVRDNIAFGLRMRKQYSPEERDRLVEEAAATLGLDELLKRRPGELSGGQRQRVALGRAMVRRPQAFLMDEPLSNLDSKLRVQMRAELIRLHRELAGTFIYVTHDQVEAMTMGERVAVLDSGVLQQVGHPQDVYDRPANLFVAAFIGSPAMNLLDAEPAEADGARGLRTENGFVRLPDDVWRRLEREGVRSAVIGIRPEHLVPAESIGGDVAVAFDSSVDLVESLGSEQHVTVALEHGSLVAKLPAAPRLKTGEPLRLAVAAEHLHMFDAESKRRIAT